MLFVDRHEAEAREGRGFLNESMRADDEHGLARGEPRRDRFAFPRRKASRQQHRIDAERREQIPHRSRVLIGEELGGNHDRGLIAVLDREQRREQCHDRLPAADVALEQPLHAAVA